jgi:hypothetical protein
MFNALSVIVEVLEADAAVLEAREGSTAEVSPVLATDDDALADEEAAALADELLAVTYSFPLVAELKLPHPARRTVLSRRLRERYSLFFMKFRSLSLYIFKT